MHWSIGDDNESSAAPAEAALRPPLEAIPEILERLHGREPELVAELLAELAKADIVTLARLFGCAPRDELPSVKSAPLEPEPAEPRTPDRVVWSKPGAPEPEPRGPVWDDTGGRIWPPHRSVFPRQDPLPRGSHWSR
jgi:hypothetical protein